MTYTKRKMSKCGDGIVQGWYEEYKATTARIRREESARTLNNKKPENKQAYTTQEGNEMDTLWNEICREIGLK
jgi:hypothetical protein